MKNSGKKLIATIGTIACVVIGSCKADFKNPYDVFEGEVERILASDGQAGDQFGECVSVSNNGDTIVVGASQSTVNGKAFQGAVYVYRFNGTTWKETRITASDGVTNDQFGQRVAVSRDGSKFIVGAPAANSAKGKAYIYSLTGSSWQEYLLTASDGAADDQFGSSVAINRDGGKAVVGAPNVEGAVPGFKPEGSAYLYAWNTNHFDEVQILKSSTGPSWQKRYGQSVAIDSDGATGIIVIVAAGSEDLQTGKVYYYRGGYPTVTEEAQLTASPSSTDLNWFGTGVALSSGSNTLIIGSMFYDYDLSGPTPFQDRGAAYIFTRSNNTWTQQPLLSPDYPMASLYFGANVAISSDGKTAVITAPGENRTPVASYIFRFNGTTWVSEPILLPEGNTDWLNAAISGDGRTVVFGRYQYKNGANAKQGAIYITRIK